MAKHPRKADAGQAGAAQKLSAKVSRAIDAIRKPFTEYADLHLADTQSRAELAPKFMQAFGLWLQEVGGSFVQFVSTLDPTVPVGDRAAYRAHKSYQAAEYLRRLAGRPRAGERGQARPMRSAVTNLARMIATVLPLVADQEIVWKAIQAEFDLKPRQIGRLRQIVGVSQPLLRIPMRHPVGQVEVVHQPVQVQPAADQQGNERAA